PPWPAAQRRRVGGRRAGPFGRRPAVRAARRGQGHHRGPRPARPVGDAPPPDDTPAAADAPLVARLRAAGAEVFATAQCLEFAAGFANPRVGDTRNPRDRTKTSGGSSGGETGRRSGWG